MPGSKTAPPPKAFARALLALRATVNGFNGVEVCEIPAPTQITPYACALRFEVPQPSLRPPVMGRFVALYDPNSQPGWEGPFRIIVLIHAHLEDELGRDPLLSEVAWSWLNESLERCEAPCTYPTGTVTRILSQSFGEYAPTYNQTQVEVRASWSPLDDDLGANLSAAIDLAKTCAGQMPGMENVAKIYR